MARLMAIVFFALGAFYHLGTDHLRSSFPVMALWTCLLALVLILVDRRIVFASLALHTAMALALVGGIALSASGELSTPYLRTVATSFVLSSVVAGLMSGRLVRTDVGVALMKRAKSIDTVLVLVVALWIVSSVTYIWAWNVRDSRLVFGFNYQTLSDCVAMFGLCLLASKRNSVLAYIVVMIVTAVALSVIGSRMAAGLFFLLAVIGLYRNFSNKSAFYLILALAVFAILGLAAVASRGYNVLLYRITSILNVFTDESLRSRLDFFGDFGRQIAENPWCALTPCLPTPGYYVHNILSVVEYFGILGIIILVISIILLISNYKLMWSSSWFMVLLYASTQLLVARSWLSIVFPVFIGAMQYLALRKFAAAWLVDEVRPILSIRPRTTSDMHRPVA